MSIYLDPGILLPIAYLSRVEWQVLFMIGVYDVDSMVRGQHVYKSIWTPLTNQHISVSCRKTTNMANDWLWQYPKGGCKWLTVAIS